MAWIWEGQFWDLTDQSAPFTFGVTAVTGAIISPFFALGGAINEATGGTTPSLNVYDYATTGSPLAPAAPPPPATYSPFIQAASGYDADSDTWGLPVLNQNTGSGIVQPVFEWAVGLVGDSASGALKGLLGSPVVVAALAGIAYLMTRKNAPATVNRAKATYRAVRS